MKLKTRCWKTLLCLCFFVAFIFTFSEIKINDTKSVSAADTVYYSVSSSDFVVNAAGKTNTDFLFRFDYIGNVQEVANSLASYTPFSTETNALQTNDGLVDLKSATAYNKKFAVYIACTPINVGSVGFDENIHTKVIIPKGQRFSQSGVGFELADDLVLVKTGDGTWEIATTKETVPVSVTIGGVTTEEEMEKDGSYMFPSVDAVAKKTFVGWEVCDKLYATGETVQIADCIDEETQSVAVKAVYLEYALIDGAAIRCDKDMSSSGIRFTAVLNGVDELPAYITGLGVIVMPQDLMGKAEYTLDNYSGAGQAKDFFAQRADISADANGVFEFRATIVSVLEQNYNRAFSARAYVAVQTRDGEVQYRWCDAIETRSVYQVASLAVVSVDNKLSAQQTVIAETYINKVANITFDGNTASVVSKATTPVIKSVHANKTNETVTLELETSESNFVALTYNGERIKEFSVQSKENGLIITFTVDEV